ncbi:MAG TPA: hypothetical protein VKQ08_02175, partial [Cyclobacteriaceae bacterium]|nr:hypothetical protein [Cyclobacteriaceae bacterium]
ISAREWWEEVVMGSNRMPTRKDIILSAANQDGGAHVDANPNQKTKELIQGIGKFSIQFGGIRLTKELSNHHFYLMRQFAHEVLNSPDVWQPIFPQPQTC